MIPTRIGQKFEGGYFAGVIRVRDCAYLILAAPKSTECSIPFKPQWSGTPGTQLGNNGWANTNAMNDAEHPAAQYCRNLNVCGHTDLYLPSRDEGYLSTIKKFISVLDLEVNENYENADAMLNISKETNINYSDFFKTMTEFSN